MAEKGADIMNIETDERCLAQIMRHEGTVRDRDGLHVAYACPAGRLTIGYGHNLDDNPVPGLSGASHITEAYARTLLREDCARIAAALDEALPDWRSLAEARQAVLLNMAFNLGVRGLLRFVRMLEAVGREDWDAARAAMLNSRWARQVGRRAVELAAQMQRGTWDQKAGEKS